MTDVPPEPEVRRFAAWVLRTGSPDGLDQLAAWATSGRHDARGLLALARDRDTTVSTPLASAPLVELARACLLTAADADELDAATRLLDLAVDRWGTDVLDGARAADYAQALLRTGRTADSARVREAHQLAPMVDWGLRVDAANPVLGGSDPDAWLTLLGEPFRAAGLEAPLVSHPVAPAFVDLGSPATDPVEDEETVTVVMSAFRPGPEMLMAVRSVLAQSWRNLELLVVDDASPPGHEEVFAQVRELDPRVRLLRADRNRGTYAARNLGLQEARGSLVTNHDSDDWMHPRRLEHHVAVLREDPDLLACRSWALRAHPDLTTTYVGYPPHRINAASIMVRAAEVRRLAGGFDLVRKSADMELPNRLKALRPGSVRDLPEDLPLQISQLTSGSLSRLDARPGWTHWSRIAYRDAYTTWHARIREGRAGAVVRPAARRPFPLPEPTWAPDRPAAAGPRHYDVVVLNDWRVSRGSQADLLDLVRTLVRCGRQVAVAHAEAPRPLAKARERTRRELHELLRTEPVDLVHLGTELSTDHVLVADPATFGYRPGARSRWTTGAVTCLLRAGSAETTPGTVERIGHHLGGTPVWSPQPGGPAAPREVDEGLVRPSALLRTVPPPLTRPSRAAGRTQPVLGHDLPDEPASWPADAGAVRDLWADPEVGTVLLAHPGATATRLLGRTVAPPHWLTGDGRADRAGFLSQLDFYVASGAAADLELPLLRAVAAGCVPVVQEDWRPLLHEAALYADPHTAADRIRAAYRDQPAMVRLRDTGVALLERRARHTVEELDRLAAASPTRGRRHVVAGEGHDG